MTALLTPIPAHVVSRAVAFALEEDFGRGDITTAACVPDTAQGQAVLAARKALVLAGVAVFRETFRQVDPSLVVTDLAQDGALLPKGTSAVRVQGKAASILQAERVALNFVQRMSGIATLARSFVDALPTGSKTRVTDTRKTTPGLRAFERYAVRCGGAHNHREDLSSAVLIKDNHIAASGGVTHAITRARAHAPHTSRIECEVDSMEQLHEALEARADIVLLDNFDDKTLGDAVKLVAGRALIEISGGITLDRIALIAAAGVDIISVGALTHSAPAVDLGLDWIA
ncbi:MAG: carboxylating nicotinate-nucleotide diphosphorylase [Sandaracinaceae bacterium]|nr:carboxylating nicotinate-nucleotide diphosphorylase [Sandaracinaceae bacterium]